MKRLLNKGFIVFAVAVMMALVSAENVSAQRPGRGGGGFHGGGRSGSFSGSRGGGSFSRQSAMPGRGSFAPHTNNSSFRSNRSTYVYNRTVYRGGVGFRGYRPGFGYHYAYGRPYYRPYFSYYNYYRPFIGFRIGVLPYGYYPFYFGANQFYYSGGLFYQQNNNQYEVVVPPVGAEVPNLPEDAKLVTINNVDYYEYKGVYYTQSQNADGKTVYVVAGKDGVLNTPNGTVDSHQIGDMINQLPEGCREVTIKNEKYFVSPDDIYYEEVVDGNNITYRVIGKLF